MTTPQTPRKPKSEEVEKQNDFASRDYKNQMKEAEGKQTPGKATDRMATQFSNHAEGNKPNMGGQSGKRSENADREKQR